MCKYLVDYQEARRVCFFDHEKDDRINHCLASYFINMFYILFMLIEFQRRRNLWENYSVSFETKFYYLDGKATKNCVIFLTFPFLCRFFRTVFSESSRAFSVIFLIEKCPEDLINFWIFAGCPFRKDSGYKLMD